MRDVIGLLLVGLVLNQVSAQKANEQTPKRPAAVSHMGPGATYEDCVARCEKCGSDRNPDCVKNFCTSYPHRQPGAAPLPVVCPQTN